MGRSDDFGIGRHEQNDMTARAFADHLTDGMARIAGFHDWDHMVTAQRNETELAFLDKYSTGGRGSVGWDPDRDTHVYKVHHPSGWIGVHIGPHTEMSHVTTPGESHDMWSYLDHSRHGFLTPMEPHEWPSPAQVDRDVDEWVRDHGKEFEDNYLRYRRH